MKTKSFFISFFLLTSLNLFAKDSITQIHCIHNKVHILVDSNQLNLTDEAVVDNTGGYVDIPEERFYLKSNSHTYKLQGKVVKNKDGINQLQAIIEKKDLTTLPFTQSITLIQKIDLLENNQEIQAQNITTTNKLTIIFNKTKAELELQRCIE